MSPERWKQVNKVFCSALECEPGQRAVFLDEACTGDVELRKEVESLIRHHEQTGSFIDSPAFDVAAQKLSEDQRELVEGQVLGHYTIVSLLGAGGMGEVYLAQDSKLRRKVALKLLSVSLTKDEERVRRFEQEAHAASALNHPNILTVYDVDQVEGLHFIASEYIAGKTLRQHITEANLSLSELLDVAIQVAGALSAAHEEGIVHRDIKPENIMLRPDGYVKVLDFGLAKLTEKQTTVTDTRSPTLAAVKTDTGVVMGTAHYMSPEQARGIAVDVRTDIFSLGIVIYEMVTGRVPFEGETPSHVIVAILEKEPASLESHLSSAPAELQRVVSKALAKDRDERYESARDLLIDLKALRQGLESEPKVDSPATRRRHKAERASEKKAITVTRPIWLAALLALVIAGAAWLYFPRKASEPSLPPMTVTPFTTFEGFERGPSFSPDGKFMAFVWGGEKNDNIDIYIQRIGSSGPPFRLTDDPAADFHPVWSPDGSQIAFARFKSETDKANYIKPALGGPERKIYSSSVKAFWGGDKQMDWSPDGKFLVAPDRLSEGGPYHILLMSPETLERRQLTFAPDYSFGDLHPEFSPDSQSIAFVRANGNLSAEDVYVIPLAGGEPRRLTFDNQHIECLTWTADGRGIVFSSNRSGIQSLWKVSSSGGTPERLPVGEIGASAPDISRQGNRLAFVKQVSDANIYRISLDRSARGRSTPTKFASSTQTDWIPNVSPDGQRVAFTSDRSGQHEIWLCDNTGSNLSQLTSYAAASPRWSPDGQQIAFDSREGGATSNVYVISSQGRCAPPSYPRR